MSELGIVSGVLSGKSKTAYMSFTESRVFCPCSKLKICDLAAHSARAEALERERFFAFLAMIACLLDRAEWSSPEARMGRLVRAELTAEARAEP